MLLLVKNSALVQIPQLVHFLSVLVLVVLRYIKVAGVPVSI